VFGANFCVAVKSALAEDGKPKGWLFNKGAVTALLFKTAQQRHLHMRQGGL
jgi:hypothetical protein